MHGEQIVMGKKVKRGDKTPESKDKLIKRLKEKLKRNMKKMRELKQETKELLTELDEAYKALRRTRAGLAIKEKLSVAGRLAAGVAHELRNSLNIISISVEYLHSKFNDGDERREFTEAIMNKVEKLNSITTDLIHYAQPHNPHFEKSDIHKVLDRTLNLVRFKCIGQKVKVIREYAINFPVVEIDNGLMEKVILNLLDNALWAMPERGKLIIATRIPPVNSSVEIKIIDSGCGISSKDISCIFDPFFTRREDGTGLGLSVVHRIVEEHKGSIEVESELKKGTTFTITLPTSQKNDR